ncbi:DUF2939 domain-containing protein [Longimicrobium terrae]|uniref:DUF2939 domain-containing protein n=1 Tax=Longimicrobium terrae TaxID=1639882 RepID=A0A841H526_9BACT|nr:DUF2939 domain-containing protein [Longimicrobium terrae]MBB4638834.1 hypothetical protein [Longimicrobium terrae]MBB6073073.1 hypothetical protein [Longimicrobium terrae]NNC30235.1 DUF2939 domain-containing protein [Longimicrobium terrae]
MRRRGTLFPFLALVACAVAAWLYCTPYLAIRAVQRAAESGDTQRLSQLVDFPALRTSLKENVRSAVSNQMAGRAGSRIGALTGFAAGALASPVVDAALTPSGIAALTQGTAPGSRRTRDEDDEPLRANLDIDRGYAGANRFEVRYRDRDSGAERLALILHRDGLGWKLASVRLPGADVEQ